MSAASAASPHCRLPFRRAPNTRCTTTSSICCTSTGTRCATCRSPSERHLLADLIEDLDDDAIRLSEHVRDEKAAIFEEACRHGAEGIVSKRADSVYLSGRSASWVKVKCGLRQEFVIGGFTLPVKGRRWHRRAAAWLLSGWKAHLRGPRRHRLYAKVSGTDSRAAGIHSLRHEPVSRRRHRRTPRRSLGEAAARRGGRLQHLDRRQPCAPGFVQGPARRQARKRSRSRKGLRGIPNARSAERSNDAASAAACCRSTRLPSAAAHHAIPTR